MKLEKAAETSKSSGPYCSLWGFLFREPGLTGPAAILDWDFKRSSLAVMLGSDPSLAFIMGTLSLLLGIDTFAHC